MGLKKSKKVSWASGPNLCQVKHYRKEDCPSKVGKRSQHHPHLKQMHCLMKSKERFSYRSLAKWKCPPKFNLNNKWQVVSGEDSKEAGDQEHREKRVIEVVCPSRHAIPPNPYTSSDLDQTYDDNQTPVIRIIPIEEETDVGVSFHLTPSQTISSKLPDACLTYSPSSSVSIVTSQKLPANGKSLPQSLSTFQNPRKPLTKSPFSVRWPSNVESTSHLKGSEQTKVSPKPPISYNSVPQYISTPDQTEIFPDQIANQNHGPKYRTICENQTIRQLESQVSEMPPAKHNPVTKSPSTCDLTVAVATAITALAKNQEQGSLIDANLLVRLLLNPEEIPKLMNEHGSANNAATGAATADSFIGIMSRPVDQLIPLPRTKTDKVINKPINERQAPYAGSGPSFGPKPMAKFAPLTMTKPETSVKSSLVNEQGAPPHLGTANIRESKSIVHPASDLNLEKIKKLSNKYGVLDNAGGKPLVNSELVPSSCSKYDVVLSSADHRTTLQPKLSLSPNVGHTSPLSSMTSPTPLRKDINYCKSLIKEHGDNCESVVDESLQNTNPRDNKRGAGLLKNQKSIQRSLTRCIFFNKPRGCRNGSSCPFLHDISGQKRSGGMSEARDSKRKK
ncbi:zinc finger CCCH domain-containing protein 6-like [Solanum dulcamara]|uniref:zinc finger CCCH domain-containing protein 6-like n=1 Tax=Solanum dulcamara TaxID=45834 RepID=UPI00248658D0|nr:zinc finger CCCH domain-containing protein 6-like [Solanum dulcamara]